MHLVFLILIGMMRNVMMTIKEQLQIMIIQIESKYKIFIHMIINIIIIPIVINNTKMIKEAKILKVHKLKYSQIIVFNNRHQKVKKKNQKNKNPVWKILKEKVQ